VSWIVVRGKPLDYDSDDAKAEEFDQGIGVGTG
jgi:hypothetical protein